MNEMDYIDWTYMTPDGVTHIGSADCDTDKACDIMGSDPQINCPQCLGGLVASLQQELKEARHHLAMLNPEAWQCMPECSYCSVTIF